MLFNILPLESKDLHPTTGVLELSSPTIKVSVSLLTRSNIIIIYFKKNCHRIDEL